MLTTLIIFLISLAIFAISFILSDKVIKSIVSDKDIIIPCQRMDLQGRNIKSNILRIRIQAGRKPYRKLNIKR